MQLAACGTSERECEARARMLQAKLDRLSGVETHLFGESAERVPVVDRSRKVANELGPLLVLSPTAISLDGRKLGTSVDDESLARLLRDLDVLHRNWGILHPGQVAGVEPLYIAAESEVSLQQLLSIVAALPEFNTPRLLVQHRPVASPDPFSPGTSSGVKRQAAAIEAAASPDERQRLLVDLIVQGNGRSEAIRSVFSRVADADAAGKNEVLLKEIVPALRSTQCRGVDLDALEVGLLLLLSPEGPPVGWLPLTLPLHSSAPSTDKISLPTNANTAQVAQALSQAEELGREVQLADPGGIPPG